MAAAIEKALEKDATKRFFDAAEFAHALEVAAQDLGLRLGPRVCKEFLDRSLGK